jgi:hypothetical protein
LPKVHLDRDPGGRRAPRWRTMVTTSASPASM